MYPARVLTPVPSGKSRLHHRNACRAWGRRGLNPHVPLPFPPDISRRGYAPVGHPGIEPGDTAVSERPLQPAGPCPEAEGEGADPHGREDRHGCSKPVAAPAAHLPERRAENSNPSACAPVRFRNDARGPGGFTLQVSALRPGVNKPEMEEDGRLERHCSHSRPVSGRGQPPDWFIFRGERVTRTPRRYPRSR